MTGGLQKWLVNRAMCEKTARLLASTGTARTSVSVGLVVTCVSTVVTIRFEMMSLVLSMITRLQCLF